ncbi:hypothetical protein Bbelb_100500 [Branchiostoma belcheri]|nr:hypothetical protein Bbelb_100500 [Branchiostoma belcheri]
MPSNGHGYDVRQSPSPFLDVIFPTNSINKLTYLLSFYLLPKTTVRVGVSLRVEGGTIEVHHQGLYGGVAGAHITSLSPGKDEDEVTDELHRLWRDHLGIRPRYAGRGASASSVSRPNADVVPPERQ